jgi:hypothetical protein
LNAEAEPELAAAVIAPVVASSIPWYRKLFTTPNLAYTLGGLILIFGGMIGFVAFQNMKLGRCCCFATSGHAGVHECCSSNRTPGRRVERECSANTATTANNSTGEIPHTVERPMPLWKVMLGQRLTEHRRHAATGCNEFADRNRNWICVRSCGKAGHHATVLIRRPDRPAPKEDG